MMYERSVWNVVKALATSRKFWLGLIAAVVTGILYVKGLIPADKLAESLVVLATAVIVAIGAEDTATKLAGRTEPPLPVCVVCGKPATHVTRVPVWYCDAHAPAGALPVVIEEIA
jgi:hypothetical protein